MATGGLKLIPVAPELRAVQSFNIGATLVNIAAQRTHARACAHTRTHAQTHTHTHSAVASTRAIPYGRADGHRPMTD